jgi:hypothetical protein
MRFLSDLGSPVPRAFHSAAEFILNSDLRRELSSQPPEVGRVKSLLDEAKAWKVELDSEGLGYLLQQNLGEMMTKFVATPEDTALLSNLVAAVEMARSAPFTVNFWQMQNLFYETLQTIYPEFRNRAQQGDETAKEWLSQFVSLGEKLSIRIT